MHNPPVGVEWVEKERKVATTEELDVLKALGTRISTATDELRADPDRARKQTTLTFTSEEVWAITQARDYAGRPYVWPEKDGTVRFAGAVLSPVSDDEWVATIPRGHRGLDWI